MARTHEIRRSLAQWQCLTVTAAAGATIDDPRGTRFSSIAIAYAMQGNDQQPEMADSSMEERLGV